MDPDHVKEIGRQWLAVTDRWGFDAATVIRSLPALDPWVIGRAGEATCLLGAAGSRACCVIERSPDEIETIVVPLEQLHATVRDSFHDTQRSGMLSGHVARQRRTWTFRLGQLEVTVESARDQVYGRDATAGADDIDWHRHQVETRCRRLAFGPAASGPDDPADA